MSSKTEGVSGALGAAVPLGRHGCQGLTMRVIHPFDYHGVTLGAGRLRTQFDFVRERYLRIPSDDWLLGFRRRAGWPAPGVDLGGWYGRDNGNIFGQLLSGLSRMAAATDDDALRRRGAYLVHEWARCQADDGYSFYSATTAGRAYTFDKLVGGLVDAAHYGGCTDALAPLRRLTEWGVRTLDRTRDYANADGEGLPRVGWSEWYTLSENLYRAHLLTGLELYREFAAVWEYPAYWDRYAEGVDLFAPHADGTRTLSYHAYSHVNTLSGAAAAYLVHGAPHYLATLRAAHDYLLRTQCYATGGFGPNESLLPRPEWRALLTGTTRHFETQCGSWAVFKLCKYLLSFTGEARYGDWIERVLYTGIGASLPMTADGRVTYYSNYNPAGATKVLYDDYWSCCSGSQPTAVADYHDLVFLRDDDGLYVNLFVPAAVTWSHAGRAVTVTQRTRFPEDDEVTLRIDAAGPVELTLRLRTPAWLRQPLAATIGDCPAKLVVDARGWATLRRTWLPGDTLVVRVARPVWGCPLDSDAPSPAAVLCGPVVLALRAPEHAPHGRVPLSAPGQALVEYPAEPLHFAVADDATLLARPLYVVGEGEPYYVYLYATPPA